MSVLVPSDSTTLPQWIGIRSSAHPERPAATFIDDTGETQTWTYRQLWQNACNVAGQLPPSSDGDGASSGNRALLLYPQGLEFLAAFLGCQMSGWIPVPTCFPKPHREMPRLNSAAIDCSPAAILADADTLQTLSLDKLPDACQRVERIVTGSSDTASVDSLDPDQLNIDPESLALLQYTSGSTSEPKGVMVRHRNLMSNLETIRQGFQIDWEIDDATDVETGVFWLPYYHDMGLIGGILEPLYAGRHTVLMSPRAFLQRPLRWLQTISDYGASISGAPNFAYQLCVDRIPPDQTDHLDLSCWRLAFSGAEPVLPRTVKEFAHRFESAGFRSSSFYPCYGLAEATLLAAGFEGAKEPVVIPLERADLEKRIATVLDENELATKSKKEILRVVCCGPPAHATEIVIVDPDTCVPLEERRIGEVWIRGGGVTNGYWGKDSMNEIQFDAELAAQPPGKILAKRSGFCRTGDLGFLHHGQLYLSGRQKDVIIIRGRNLFPQDIEVTVKQTLGSEYGNCAAFPVSEIGSESLAVVIELPRQSDESQFEQVVRDVRRSVIEVHEVDPQHIWLLRPASIPLTSSGKIQRGECRTRFEADQFKTKHRYDRSSMAEQTPIAFPVLPSAPIESDRETITTAIASWMTQWLVSRAGVEPDEIDGQRPFEEYGLDSMTAVELSGETADWSGVELTPLVAWNHPTIEGLSGYIADELIGR